MLRSIVDGALGRHEWEACTEFVALNFVVSDPSFSSSSTHSNCRFLFALLSQAKLPLLRPSHTALNPDEVDWNLDRYRSVSHVEQQFAMETWCLTNLILLSSIFCPLFFVIF